MSEDKNIILVINYVKRNYVINPNYVLSSLAIQILI